LDGQDRLRDLAVSSKKQLRLDGNRRTQMLQVGVALSEILMPPILLIPLN
jgi:hypothetical protein